MAEPGSVRKDTAGHMFESLRIQEYNQATGNQKMKQMRCRLPFRLWNVLEGLPHSGWMH
jgi:hypothetical protein